jgi:hypothetical protein
MFDANRALVLASAARRALEKSLFRKVDPE